MLFRSDVDLVYSMLVSMISCNEALLFQIILSPLQNFVDLNMLTAKQIAYNVTYMM